MKLGGHTPPKIVNLQSQARDHHLELWNIINITQQYTYDNELFNAKSQKDLTSLLRKTLLNSDDYGLMPANIGIENPSINDLISQYNLLISERDKYLFNAGPNNTFLKNLERQIIEFSKNIFLSIDNYLNTLNIKISNIREKEKEFEIVYNSTNLAKL